MDDQAMEFGRELRRLRQDAGLSLARLGARVPCSKSRLSKVERGMARPDRALAAACEAALGAPGALAPLLPDARPRGAKGFSGLPTAPWHFVGRIDELSRIRAVLRDRDSGVTTCVLHGIAGVGKTALALRAAWDAEAQFPDGCLFLDLGEGAAGSAGMSSAEALSRLLHQLGVPGKDTPGDTGGRASLYRDRLRGKQMLLVLDDARSAEQVTPLLPAELRCGVLVTSRNRLNALDGAVRVLIDRLPAAQAVELFQAAGDARVPDYDEAVARVVEHCGRLPLAVHIAAARFRSNPLWTPADLAARLADPAHRMRVLDDGERSISVAMSKSYRDLSAEQRRMLGLLTLHPGDDITVRASAALAGMSVPEAEHLLWALYDAHLVTLDPAGGYVRIHDLARLSVTEHVLPTLSVADQDAAMHRLLDLALFQASASDSLVSPHRYRPAVALPGVPDAAKGFADKGAALTWLHAQWPSLVELCGRAAILGRHEHCWKLALFLRDYFFHEKLWGPWIDTHRAALMSARREGDVHATAMTLNNLGMAHLVHGEAEAARSYYAEGLRLFRSLADEHGVATTQCNLAWANLALGHHAGALRQLKIALEFYRRTGAERNVAITLRGIALAEVETGAFADALLHAEQAREKARELALESDMPMVLNCIAWINGKLRGRRDEANSQSLVDVLTGRVEDPTPRI